MTKPWRERYKVHPAAEAFPMMSDEELNKLAEDIKANGLKVHLTFDEDHLLMDGRNRLAAMEIAGCELHSWQWNVYRGDDPVSHIISLNAHRRHLTKEQMVDSIVAACKHRLANNGEMTKTHVKGKRGSVKDVLKAAVVADAERRGISKRTAERGLAKVEGRQKKKRDPLSAEQLERKARVKAYIEERKAKQDAAELQKYDRQVADLLDAIKAYEKAGTVALTATSKFAPEAKRFTIRRLRAMQRLTDKLISALAAKPIPDDIALLPDGELGPPRHAAYRFQ
jgi:hypothetical protein